MTIEFDGLAVGLTRSQIIGKLQEKLSDKRFEHVLRVEQMAIKLAKLNQANVQQAALAGLVHDYAKEFTDQQFIEMIAKKQLDPDLLNWGNAIWHGEVGAYFVEKDLQVADKTVLKAISEHTVGASEMSVISQILFVADYIELGRDFPGVKQAREISYQNLAAGVWYEISNTLAYLVKQEVPIYPKTVLTYNAWIPSQLKEKK